ncbi:MAG: hypothetical protein ACUVQP_00410 [Bacteroidales bacterium]
MKLIALTFIFIFFTHSLFGQTDTSQTFIYNPNSTLKDGIYFSFDQFIKQQPLPFVKVINFDNYAEKDAFFKQKQIQFFDEYGIEKIVDTKNIWGYVLNNTLYIFYNKEFYRVSYIGTLTHFIATQTVRNYTTPYDPYYGYYAPFPSQVYETTNLIQNIIDLRNGKLYPFTPEAILALISDDSELFNEYISLKKKKKKEMMFYYLRKYNDKHPLILHK